MDSARYSALTEEDSKTLIKLVGLLPCAALDCTDLDAFDDTRLSKFNCCVCDEIVDNPSLDQGRCQKYWVESCRAIASLLNLRAFLESKQARLQAMMTLRRLTLHCSDKAEARTMSLRTWTLGQWCLQSLKSSIRELRIAAG